MAEYFIDIERENKSHSLRVLAQFRRGRDLVAFPTNEEEYLAPPEPDEVEIFRIFVETEDSEKEIQLVPQWLEDAITEKIIEKERYGV